MIFGHGGGERRADEDLNGVFGLESFHSGGGHFGDHIHLPGLDCLTRRWLLKRLEDDFIDLGGREMILVCRQLNEFVLGVFHHLEGTTPDHGYIIKLDRVLAAPNMFGEYI